jgi:dihydropteroate synthase
MQLLLPDSYLDLSCTRVMGILNVTPDSFSDGGQFIAADAAVEHALAMVAAGADLIDIGGESTRPGARAVGEAEEIDRVVPVIEGLRAASPVPISVDSSKPAVMRAAVAAGAGLINDVRALEAPGALTAAAELGVPVCLMHMQGEPVTMQDNPKYQNVTYEVKSYLENRIAAAVAAGVAREQIVIDPGFGFGKTLAHNLRLLNDLDAFVATGMPVLVGVSRKSMIGAILKRAGLAETGDPAEARLIGSVTLALYAARKGAHIVRVHDVRETVEALAVQVAAAS